MLTTQPRAVAGAWAHPHLRDSIPWFCALLRRVQVPAHAGNIFHVVQEGGEGPEADGFRAQYSTWVDADAAGAVES